jgi:hypothetical protein
MTISAKAYSLLPLALAAAVLIGCASPAYNANLNSCERIAYSKVPPNMQQTLGTFYRQVQIPTGVTTCETYMRQTTCVQQTRTELQPYQAHTVKDLNLEARADYARNCAQQRCYSSHGNARCK